jgi:hypothetical protein
MHLIEEVVGTVDHDHNPNNVLTSISNHGSTYYCTRCGPISMSKVDIPKEFLDVIKVLEFGAGKYEAEGWLLPNAPKMDHKSNHDIMFHHLSESYSSPGSLDEESYLEHLLHLACRALMGYTRLEREIMHERDE